MMSLGSSGFMMWVIAAIAAIIVVLAVLLLLRRASGAAGSGSSGEETSLEILEKRYARGEITKEEFERMKRDLGLY
jgi:putative membrane protein